LGGLRWHGGTANKQQASAAGHGGVAESSRLVEVWAAIANYCLLVSSKKRRHPNTPDPTNRQQPTQTADSSREKEGRSPMGMTQLNIHPLLPFLSLVID